MEERVPVTQTEPSTPVRQPQSSAVIRDLVRQEVQSSFPMVSTKAAVPTMTELLETKTPQTDWWLSRSEDGTPVHWPLLLASLPIVAILAVPLIAALLLLLPAAVPLLAIAPIFVLASLPWWLHLPLTGKPLLIPLALLTVPVVAFFGIVALSLLPMMLIVLVPIFCLIPWVIMTTLPLFGVFSCVGIPLLNYVGVPVWLSIKWTWPLPDFTQMLTKLRTAKKEILAKA
jgi:hypothetical protein